ncbi:frizzled-2-like [Mizuhopecten yessoensis]|uniref:frizzled-2-like n=1 Tax=Mizuhopecten yessoensis TaxID=6573 RepID=UPI000B45BCE8|nr:frizzled-2-like [Mizuhopecten yessoensis]
MFICTMHRKGITMRTTLLLYTVFFLLGVHLAVSQQSDEGPCQTITVSMCSTMPYNLAFMPNRFGQSRMDDAGLEIHQFLPLVRVHCSAALLPFLCAAYFPKCSARGGGLEPCARLCREARNGCESLMNKFGFQWPVALDCDSFSENYRCYDVE